MANNVYNRSLATHLRQAAALRRLIFISLICALTLAGVWQYTKSRNAHTVSSQKSISQQGPQPIRSYDSMLEKPNKTFTLTVNGEKYIHGPRDLKVTLGDSVRINLKATGTEEAHAILPAFGVKTESAPSDNTPGALLFIADKPGSFEFYTYAEGDINDRTPLGNVTVIKP